MRRTFRSRQERDALVAEFEQSKLSVSEFARRHGIPASSVHNWRAAVRQRAALEVKPAEVAFVEVVAGQSPQMADSPRALAEAWLEVEGRSVLCFRCLPEAGYLSRLVRALVA